MVVECSCGESYILEDKDGPRSFECESCGAEFVRAPAHHVGFKPLASWFRGNKGTLLYAVLAALVIAVLAGVLNTAVAEVGQAVERPGVAIRTESVPSGVGEGAVGRGVFKVINESGSTIVLRLVGPRFSDSRTVLVPAWKDGHAFGLVPGTWAVKYCAGSQWLPEIRRFAITRACGELDQTIDYTESIQDETLKYTAAVVRFGPAPREVPPAHPIAPEDFAGD